MRRSPLHHRSVHRQACISGKPIRLRALGIGLEREASATSLPCAVKLGSASLSLAKPRFISNAWLATRTRTVLAGGGLAQGDPRLRHHRVRRGPPRPSISEGRRASPGDRIYVSGPLLGPASKGYSGAHVRTEAEVCEAVVAVSMHRYPDGLALAGPAAQLYLRGLIIEPSGYDHFR